MDRGTYIERILRQIYGGMPSDDSEITVNLVNNWLNDAIALAAKQNYKENIAVDGIGYVNNSFYTTFKGLSVVEDEQFVWKVTLPQLPLGIGHSEGVSTLKFKSSTGEVSLPCVPLSENQSTYFETMRPVPNKVLFKSNGTFLYALSTLILNQYTASVTMVSGGDATDLDSIINVPYDYFNTITEYIKGQLLFERMQPVDVQNDGQDAVKTT